MIIQVTKEERSTAQGVAWARKEHNVQDNHRLKYYNKLTSLSIQLHIKDDTKFFTTPRTDQSDMG